MATVKPPSSMSSQVAARWFSDSSACRINTDIQLYWSIKSAHPNLEVTVVPVYSANLKSYAADANNDASIHDNPTPSSRDQDPMNNTAPPAFCWLGYSPPARRLDGGSGSLSREVFFESYRYRWAGHEFLVYYADGRDGSDSYGKTQNQYIVTTAEELPAVHSLVKTVGKWMTEPHNAVWVFTSGRWLKDSALYKSIQKSSWDDIILDHELKEDLLATIESFYSSRDEYKKLRVPWKRGLIFHGPPGNGKTVSLKATMHTLYDRNPPIPTLYVKSLSSMGGLEYSITRIFDHARQEAPCFLVFEDLDSMITPGVRSFFLNAVDGLSENEGILMVGSTNHLDLLDPGLSKRPSRFDRKYLFPDPNRAQRERYCEYWQRKLSDNKDIEWPDILNPAFARMMHGFSFAYMQEAFVSSLLEIAGETTAMGAEMVGKKGDHDHDHDQDQDHASDGDGDGSLVEKWRLLSLDCASDDDDGGGGGGNDDAELKKYLLYRKVKKQVDLLRKEM